MCAYISLALFYHADQFASEEKLASDLLVWVRTVRNNKAQSCLLAFPYPLLLPYVLMEICMLFCIA